MYYFIVNPNSGCGKGDKIWKKAERILKASDIKYEVHLTKRSGDAKRLSTELTEGCKIPKIIVAVGGDGTLNEILDGLAFCGPVTLGYIPAGSGNDLARSLKLPKSPYKCLKKILSPKYHKLVDYGVISYGDEVISHRRFAVSSGIGYDGAVCHNLLYSRLKVCLNKLHMGRLSYIAIGIKQLILARPSKGYLILDGVQKVEFNHIYFISAHIHPYEGGGFKFSPKADCCDGKLSLCVVHNSMKWKLIPFLFHAFLGDGRKLNGVRFFDCREAVIHTEHPMAVHADGESCLCQQDLQISCIEKKLRVIV